jgi:pyruvate dehydrogenase E2 component (dihydrolipoamide acetyltransferase)
MEAILMPVIGHDIPKGQIVRWHKQENESVEKGEVVLEVESEKATFEVEAERSGVILKILHEEGEEVDVLQPVGYIGSPEERYEESLQTAHTASAAPAMDAAPSVDAVQPSEKIFASPLARRVAREYGVDLKEVSGTGPHGRIIKKNVLQAVGRTAQPHTDQSIEGERIVFSGHRQAIADRLTKSKQHIPHFYLYTDIDMESALCWRWYYNQKYEVHVTINDMVIHAVAGVLKEFSNLNAHVTADSITALEHINIGVAVAVEQGLIVPVIQDADKKPINELSGTVRSLTTAAREGKSLPAAAAGFTVSTLGSYGVNLFFPVINPPESGILGVGAVEQRVVAENGMIGVKSMMSVGLSCDHRAVDGVYAARFLQRLKQQLETGFTMEE